MGTALIKVKIMPESPSADLKEIERIALKLIEKGKGKTPRVETEPIAFGLVAVIIAFAIDESNPVDPLIEEIAKIENVSSAEIVDFRRAFG